MAFYKNSSPECIAFANDLKSLRRKRKISFEALQKKTKIMPEVLHHFEETALVDHPHFNAVYIRAIIRLYASTIGLREDEALKAFEEASERTYQGRLREPRQDTSSESRASSKPEHGPDSAKKAPSNGALNPV